METTSKKISLLILGLTALVCSRMMFAFFDDPEGPNLLVVVGAALIIYGVSLLTYASNLLGLKRFFLAVFIQVAMSILLYFCLSYF